MEKIATDTYSFEFKLGEGGPCGARALPDGAHAGGVALPDGAIDAATGRGARPARPSSLAAAALAQIKEKGYAEKYLREGKKVTLVGAAFDADMRNLSDRRIEKEDCCA